MSINSLAFLGFLLAAVVLYYLLPKQHRWVILFAASLVFYLTYGLRAGLYFLVTIVLTYGFGLWLDRLSKIRPAGQTREERQAEKQALKRKKRAVLTAILLLNFASLLLLKYSASWVVALDQVFHLSLPVPSFLLPLGISFYVFQTSAYLIDVSKGKAAAERNFLRYALFAAYFPQLVQGPINRYQDLAPQLFRGNDFDWANIQNGVWRMLYGILKKALIADALAPLVQSVYSGFYDYPGVVSFLGAALYCLQLYCDFSGGIDLVCGASELFGVHMMENFRQPYFSTSLADFWRRWHISLGEWMKDYLFYPLALSKSFQRFSKWCRKVLPPELAKRATPCVVTFIVFLAVGVWQGPGLSNLAYGMWNGFWMSLGLLWVPKAARLRERYALLRKDRLMQVFGILRTNLLVIVGRYFSRATSLMSALRMLKHTLVRPGFSAVSAEMLHGLGLTMPLLIQVGLACAVLLAVSLAQERGVRVSRWITERPWGVQFALMFLALLLAVFCVYANVGYTPIAYVYENI